MSRRAELTRALAVLAPKMPRFEAGVVIDRALDSRGLQVARASGAAWLALVAYVRHAHTEYDALLEDGYDVESARHFVLDDMRQAVADWGVGRPLTGVDAIDPDSLGP